MNWPRISQMLSLIAAGIGAAAFAGWTFGISALVRISPAWVTMKANTALALILCGAAVAALRDEHCDSLRRRLAQLCGLIAILIGALTLFQSVAGIDLGIDQALFKESAEAAGRSIPGRMGPASSITFVLFGIAIVFFDVRTKRGTWPAQICASTAAAITFLVFLSYFYNVEIPPSLAPYISIALHTVVAFLLLSVAILLARPTRGFVGIFLAQNTGGIVSRRMLPTALLVPALLGWLFILARERGYYGRGVAVALLAVSVTAIFTGLVWWIARALERTDADRRRAETAREQLASIVASSEDAIVSKDLNGIITSWNDGARRLFGYSAEEMIGHSILGIIPPNRHGEEQDLLRRLRAGEHISHYETVRVCKEGRSIHVSATLSPIRDASGKIVGASKIARDISERKHIEAELLAARDAAESANRAKDEFLAALSHELRTPLTPVLLLAAEMEKSVAVTPGVRRDFAMIRKNVELESRIIDDLLDLTRITRHKLALHFETVEVHALITHALAILRSDREAKRIAIELDLSAEHHHVEGDAVRLQQVFWNVLKNAIKFTPERGVIRISSWAEGDRLRVATSDSGLGITVEEMPRIFTAFTQGREAASSRFGGLGLGMSISALLVHEHGGRIWAESAGRDQGATFHLELPLAAQAEPEVERQPTALEDGARLMRILLVEDHEDTRGILQRLMSRWGHRVTTAASVKQAREEIEKGVFDMLLSDLGLPDGTGYDVIAAFRKRSDAPSIAMSGFGMEADLVRSQQAGFTEHLVKPISADRLKELIKIFAGAKTPT